MISETVWENYILPGIGDAEFDWFGIDQNGYMGAFSTFNRGYIPEVVKSSRIEYIELLTAIEDLPFRFKAILLTKEKGIFYDWLEYAQQGFIGYDYQDVNKSAKTSVFEIISKPDKLITIAEVGLPNRLIEKMPKFNLSFTLDQGIEVQELKDKIIKNEL